MHANARLTPEGRRILVERIAAGRPAAHVAAEMGISRTTAYRWWHRYQSEGDAGLVDRSSRPYRCPHRTPVETEARIVELRRTLKLGPARIRMLVSMPASTVWRVLCRHGLNRVRWMDRPTGLTPVRLHRSQGCSGLPFARSDHGRWRPQPSRWRRWGANCLHGSGLIWRRRGDPHA